MAALAKDAGNRSGGGGAQNNRVLGIEINSGSGGSGERIIGNAELGRGRARSSGINSSGGKSDSGGSAQLSVELS